MSETWFLEEDQLGGNRTSLPSKAIGEKKVKLNLDKKNKKRREDGYCCWGFPFWISLGTFIVVWGVTWILLAGFLGLVGGLLFGCVVAWLVSAMVGLLTVTFSLRIFRQHQMADVAILALFALTGSLAIGLSVDILWPDQVCVDVTGSPTFVRIRETNGIKHFQLNADLNISVDNSEFLRYKPEEAIISLVYFNPDTQQDLILERFNITNDLKILGGNISWVTITVEFDTDEEVADRTEIFIDGCQEPLLGGPPRNEIRLVLQVSYWLLPPITIDMPFETVCGIGGAQYFTDELNFAYSHCVDGGKEHLPQKAGNQSFAEKVRDQI